MLNAMTRNRSRWLCEKASSPLLPDAFRAMEPSNDLDGDIRLSQLKSAYNMISSRIRVEGQNNGGSYYGRRAVYSILSHPAVRYVALAFGSICAQTETLIVMNSEPMPQESDPTTCRNTFWKMEDIVFCMNIRIFDSERLFGWYPANVILHEMVLASFIYLSGSADPAHLAAQGHILHLSSLAERQKFSMDCWNSSHDHSEGENHFSAEQAEDFSSKPLNLIRKLRALLLYGTVDETWQLLELQEPGFKKAYSKVLEQRQHELDESIVEDLEGLIATGHDSEPAKMALERIGSLLSPRNHKTGYNANDPAARSFVRIQTIAIFVSSHLDMLPDELACLLPRISRWYNVNVRLFLDSFCVGTGIADTEEESPAHLLATSTATVAPQYDPLVEGLLFTQKSLEIARDPFAMLYYGAYSGNLALVKRSPARIYLSSWVDKPVAPILAAIRGGHFPVISWLLEQAPRYRDSADVIFAAVRAGGEVLDFVMEYMDLDALNQAFYQIWFQKNEQDDVVEALTMWLKDNEQKDISIYVNAMGAAAAYNRWDTVMIFLRSHTVAHATNDDLSGGINALDWNDDVTMQTLVERAAPNGVRVEGISDEDMEGLNSLLRRVEDAIG